jgi:hypothetical protein
MTLKIPDEYKLLQRKFRVSPVEFYRIQLGFIIPECNNTKLTILSYVHHYGYTEAIKKVYEHKVLTSMDSIKNYLSKLRAESYLIGYEPDVKLNEEIKLENQNNITLLILEKDENLDENDIGHRYYKRQTI